jgi:hypothetical protein
MEQKLAKFEAIDHHGQQHRRHGDQYETMEIRQRG